MAIFGVSCGFNDASLAVVSGEQILYASHAERHSKVKFDKHLHPELVSEALRYGEPNTIVYYEKPWSKLTRQLYAGQKLTAYNPLSETRKFFPKHDRILTVKHHEAHACAGYFTSPFRDAAVIVADAIGEWDTLTVWKATERRLERVFHTKYPHSLGLLYSAFTQRCGLKPNEEEYIMMGMAPFGRPDYVDDIRKELIAIDKAPQFSLRQNVHIGIGDWMPEARIEDLAASIQVVLEDYLYDLFDWTAYTIHSKNVVYMGGVALNCVANGKIAQKGIFDNWWIMPNPGDAGSSLGAALAHKRDFVEWTGPYLGTDIKRKLDTEAAVTALEEHKIIGVANGRAEFGPRALGNRSILADPRYVSTKRLVNQIKKREQFRPFAAIVLEEKANEYFYMPFQTMPYMQFTVRCKLPREVSAICHVDGTSRIQTINREQNPVIYDLLKKWYERTKCPILLNTSLNVKGMPLVNTWEDAEKFKWFHDIKIF